MNALVRILLTAFSLLFSIQTLASEAEQAAAGVQKEELSTLGTLGNGLAFGLEGSGKLVSRRKLPNRHDKNSMDEISTYSFLGVHTTWLRPGPIPEKILLHSIEVQGSRHPVSKRLTIGLATPSEIASRYGKPAMESDSALVYFAPDYVQDTRITFRFSRGVLRVIRWDFLD